jgi:arylsulfatase
MELTRKASHTVRSNYFEISGHRSIYNSGWRAVFPYPRPSFSECSVTLGTPTDEKKLRELGAKSWELYRVDEGFSETKNLAEGHRDN